MRLSGLERMAVGGGEDDEDAIVPRSIPSDLAIKGYLSSAIVGGEKTATAEDLSLTFCYHKPPSKSLQGDQRHNQ